MLIGWPALFRNHSNEIPYIRQTILVLFLTTLKYISNLTLLNLFYDPKVSWTCLFVCLFVFQHWQQEIQNKRKLQKTMRQNTIYYITTKCTAGRSHPATTPSQMAGTKPPKLTNQDSPLSLAIGAGLYPMGSQERKQRPCRNAGKDKNNYKKIR